MFVSQVHKNIIFHEETVSFSWTWLEHKRPCDSQFNFAPLGTNELWPSETNWASVIKADRGDLASLRGVCSDSRPKACWVHSGSSASLTRQDLDAVQPIKGPATEVGPLSFHCWSSNSDVSSLLYNFSFFRMKWGVSVEGDLFSPRLGK